MLRKSPIFVSNNMMSLFVHTLSSRYILLTYFMILCKLGKTKTCVNNPRSLQEQTTLRRCTGFGENQVLSPIKKKKTIINTLMTVSFLSRDLKKVAQSSSQ